MNILWRRELSFPLESQLGPSRHKPINSKYNATNFSSLKERQNKFLYRITMLIER